MNHLIELTYSLTLSRLMELPLVTALVTSFFPLEFLISSISRHLAHKQYKLTDFKKTALLEMTFQ